jgi:UDPglucose--hexose-1-phosphate uridylyltransferase
VTIRHSLAGEPILFAPQRGERPRAFSDDAALDTCPFCPGHEHETPPELARIGDPWRVRVFPNKYPAVEGAEVIVESARHADAFADVGHAEDVLRMYAERLRAHANAPYVALFRNDGARAGSSIPHVHSQLVPLPFVPPRVARELEVFARGCPLCDVEGSVIRESDAFTWLAPASSWMPYQQWLLPRRHIASMLDLGDHELVELATLLQSATSATRAIGDFNVVMMNFPRASAGHFYVEILPRVTTIAGLELGTGTFVEIIDPMAAAQRLRG